MPGFAPIDKRADRARSAIARWPLLGLVWAAVLWAHAVPAGAMLDLSQAVTASRDHDAAVRAARWNVTAITERVPQARAGLLPALSAALAAETGRVDTDIGPRRTYDNANGGLSFGLPLYRPVARAGLALARLGVEQARTDLDRVEQDLVLKVTSAYIDVLSALDALEVVIAQRRAIQEQYEAARRSFEVGVTTVTDQQEALARLDLNLAQLAAARNDLAVRKALLAQLTGREIDDLHTLRLDAALPQAEPDDVVHWVQRARTASFPVRLGEAAVKLARGAIDSARYGHHPTLDIVSQAQWTKGTTAITAGSPVDRSTQYSIALQLAIPLYSGGGISAREREAIALLNKAENELEAARRSAEQATREAFLGLGSSLEQARALAAAVRSGELALESNRVGYRVGVRINLDVLEAQQLLYQAHRDHARARYEVLLNTLRLKAAAGSLGDADVASVNALLTPRQNRNLSAPGITSTIPVAPTTPTTPR